MVYLRSVHTAVFELGHLCEGIYVPVMRMDWIWMDLGPDPYPSPNLLAKIHPYP